uniref:Neurotensin/neuromedin N n=1 Tax=Periophthalmus magnuspinnatus TaxID=409849 RepID=A0A3B3ZVZ2_9GOBI
MYRYKLIYIKTFLYLLQSKCPLSPSLLFIPPLCLSPTLLLSPLSPSPLCQLQSDSMEFQEESPEVPLKRKYPYILKRQTQRPKSRRPYILKRSPVY